MKNSDKQPYNNQINRPKISIVGRKNVGKSSLLNKLVGQDFSKVSKIPGTTLQPIEKEHELLPLGPVILVDTAGIEEEGELGEKKISKTIKILSQSDLILVVLDARQRLHPKEIELFAYIDKLDVPSLAAVNKIEFGTNQRLLTEIKELRITHFEISCKENVGINELKRKIIRSLPALKDEYLLKDVVSQGDNILIIVPESRQIPKSKIISNIDLIITEAIEKEAIIILCREDELNQTLKNLKNPPEMIITDSDTIKKIINEVPDKVKLTSFHLLMSRNKADLKMYLMGLKRLDDLQNGDKVIISELCKNHPVDDEINCVKIPALIEQYLNKKLNFIIVKEEFPMDNLSDIKLIIQCMGCSRFGNEVRYKLNEAKLLDIPIVNYSLLISYLKGTVPRVIVPFKEAISEWKRLKLSSI
jgi:[FeFe] hydrogenase H-cluster maturation GTPase HydF